MKITLFKKIRLLAQINPTALRLLKYWFSLIWITFFFSVSISRLVVSLPILKIFYAAVLLSVIGGLGYLFMFGQASAYIYYRMLLPMYGLKKSNKHNSVSKLFWFLKRSDDLWFNLIWESQFWNRQTHLDKEGIHKGDIFEPAQLINALPVVIRREHIRSRIWKPERAFAIVLLFNQIHIKRQDKKTMLDIDLRGQSCAIYSNRGKQFIYSKFVPDDPVEYLALSKATHDFLIGRTKCSNMSLQIKALRWASGGFLPVAKWHGKKWVCLFYRDIFPVGWNIANGASETKEEYKCLNKLIYREMIEELAVISGSPSRYAQLEHRFLVPPGIEMKQSNISPPELVMKHIKFRNEHDHFILKPKRGADLISKSTCNCVRVSFHEDWKDATPKVTRNIFIAINPLELGVEVVRVGEFDLQNEEVLLDGEVFTSSKGEYLVRRPVVMISADFLKRSYKDHGNSLGQRTTDNDQDDRKALELIPPGEYHVFTEELNLRQERLNNLKKTGLSKTAEAKRLNDWDRNVGDIFETAAHGGGLKDNLSTFLPVTWKTIEQAIELDVL